MKLLFVQRNYNYGTIYSQEKQRLWHSNLRTLQLNWLYKTRMFTCREHPAQSTIIYSNQCRMFTCREHPAQSAILYINQCRMFTCREHPAQSTILYSNQCHGDRTAKATRWTGSQSVQGEFLFFP